MGGEYTQRDNVGVSCELATHTQQEKRTEINGDTDVHFYSLVGLPKCSALYLRGQP